MKKIPQDIIGNIAILKFPRRTLWLIKKLKAKKFLKQNPKVTTILEKTEGFSGELRIPTTKYLAGEKTYTATYKENDCTFKFDINKTYFSPRLSNERKVIAEQVTKLIPLPTSEATHYPQAKRPTKMCNILVMFSGISPYPIVIAKRLRLPTTDYRLPNFHIYANELNKEANISAKENIHLNKLQKNITLIPGDANKLPQLLTKMAKSKKQIPNTKYQIPRKFNIILMPRPNLKETFLPTALKFSKKGTTIFYHGFGTKEKVLNEIKKDTKGKTEKINIRKAGDIGPYKFRWQAQFKIK